MVVVNDDLSIYVTRGDIASFPVQDVRTGRPRKFYVGEVVRIKVFEKKSCENVVLQKDFAVEEITETVMINLTAADTKIGEIISKPKVYWYEVERNPYDNPETFIGYDEDGAKVFKLYPEGGDTEPYEPVPEDFPVVDEELDMTSPRPVANQAIARAFYNLQDGYERTHAAVAELHVTPQMFGAIADGEADDTDSIQQALLAGDVYFPTGVYRVTTDTQSRISVPSNRHLQFAKVSTIKAINSNASVSSVLYLKDVENVVIDGATIIGDIEENASTEAGAGHGIHIQNASNITVRDCVIKNCFTDGIYALEASNIKILNTEFDNCGRLSCGTVCGRNILVEGCSARGNKRTAPKGGFYIEPNFAEDYIENVVFRNCITENMGGVGYYVTLRAMNNGGDITACFENCKDYGSETAFMVGNFAPTVKHSGYVKVTDFTSVRSNICPVSIRGYSAENTPRVYFDGLTLVDGNVSGNGIAYGSAIVFQNGGGNVDLKNIRTASDGKMFRGLYSDVELTNVNVTSHDFEYKHSSRWVNYQNGIPSVAEFTAATSTGFQYDSVSITACGVDFYENIGIGAECEIYLYGANSSFKVRKHNIGGLTTTAGQQVRLTDEFGYLKIKKVSTDLFVVLAQYGTFAN
jgi:parallel beta-helix repeat protein